MALIMNDKVLVNANSERDRSSPGDSLNRNSYKVAHNLLVSFQYAGAGLRYAFLTQRNFRIHVGIATFALSTALWLALPPVELAVIGLTNGLVLTMELLNTALEAVVDLTVQQNYHELAKIAKDCAAGAVLISAFAAIIVAGFLLIAPLWIQFQAMEWAF
jgi:diacylglycerol kinase (ATP)